LTNTAPKFTALLLLVSCQTWGQLSMKVKAQYSEHNKTLHVTQDVEYTNTSNDTLTEIYLHDWNNSYSSRNTALAQRFEEEFISNFYYANNSDYGFTEIKSWTEANGDVLLYEHPTNQADIWKITLNRPLISGETLPFTIDYKLVLPNSKFTGYGQDNKGNVYLKNWLLWPAVYEEKWILQSNKNLDDLYSPKAQMVFHLTTDSPMYIYSDLINPNDAINRPTAAAQWFGDSHNCTLILQREEPLTVFETDHLHIATDLDDTNLENELKEASIEKVTLFLTDIFGKISEAQMPVTEAAGKHSPVYVLNQFPAFLKPYPKALQFELELVKQITHNALDQRLDINPRDEFWLQSGIETYVLIQFVETHYPDLKLLGNISDWWGIRTYNLAKLPFNGQYRLFYEQAARTNRDQPLTTPKDSLLKFNQTYANPFKAGVGFKYMDSFAGQPLVKEAMSTFFKDGQTDKLTADKFRAHVEAKSSKSLSWFFDRFIQQNDKLDFKIRRKSPEQFELNDQAKSGIPFEMKVIYKDGTMEHKWIEDGFATWTDPNTEQIVLNPNNSIPEVKYNNNSATVSKRFFSYRPFKIKIGTDIEDSSHSQFFVIPVADFGNIYDGLSIGGYFTNHALLRKSFRVNFVPQFSTKSKIWTGRASLINYHNNANFKLYNITSGVFGSYNSIGLNKFGRLISPFVLLNFRDPENLRSNARQNITLRYVSITNDAVFESDLSPNYGVLNLRYGASDNNLFDYNSRKIDFQVSGDFGKLSLEYQYRKLTNKRQFNLRLFAGAFLFHNIKHTDFFDFSLDRPSDYLFEYDYLGRAESQGIFSQQIYISDGGFKSILNPRTANEWMATANVSGSIYRWIEAYGDIGWSKNSTNNSPFFVYDSGIRLNFIPDYFELYFPIFSNLGWEISQSNYSNKLRFVVTTSPNKLVELFRRKWF